MSVNYAEQFNAKETPQSEAIPGSNQVQNSAGGFSWAVDDWARLDRFLVLGAEGGSYYAQEKDLIKQNYSAVLKCIKEDGIRVVNRTVEISDGGKAVKNDPAIFVLALVCTHGVAEVRKAAYAALPKVCRIGTHIFHFAQYINSMRGWGRGLKKAISNWYTSQSADELAYQVVKYAQRDGWSHRDLLRCAHPQPTEPVHDSLFRYIVSGTEALGSRTVKRTRTESGSVYPEVVSLPRTIQGFEELKKSSSTSEVVRLVSEYNLPRECVPTQFLNSPEVWEALLEKMPLTAMIRSLGKMSAVGLISPLSRAEKLVVSKLQDKEYLKKSRVHPFSVLLVSKVYEQGHGDRGSLKWSPSAKVTDALDQAFYDTFENVQPSGKNLLLACDVSGSMCTTMMGSCLTCRDATAALALITMAVEPNCAVVAFSHELVPLNISPKMRLADVLKVTDALDFGRTDCSLPMRYALERKIPVEGFVVYTDSETWCGNTHPAQALKQYRNQMGCPSKSVVIGMVSNEFTIADPNDKGMLDIVGFDTSCPALISNFLSE